jgi:DNA-binding NtrC family response regulator
MASSSAPLAMHQPDDPTAPTHQTPSSVSRGTPRKLWAIRWVFPEFECLPTLVDGDRITVGRSRTCDFRLDGQEVSARHAVIERTAQGEGLQIRDQDSTNGVYVNGQRLTPTEALQLHASDVVRLGEHVGVVDRIPGSEAEQPTQIERRTIEIQLEVETERGTRRPERQTLGLVIGPATRASMAVVERAAPTDCSVIVVGETGTGKEYVAKALHAWSQRPGQYVGLNCWDLRGDPGLARAKLFGVEAGAFAGASPTKGAFRDAHGGTLLLDEVMELPLEVQPMLLRALQERLVQPVGGKRPVSVDVRVVVASKRPLDELVESGEFALDLYQRLCGLTVELAPLRDRKTDIPFAFVAALDTSVRPAERRAPVRAREVEPSLVEQLCLYRWTGNLRELATLAGNYRRLWDRAGQPGYRFRLEDLPYQFYGDRPNRTGKDRDRRDAAQLAALIGALRTLVGARPPGAQALRREDVHFALACERAGVQRSLGYRQFKKWEALAAKGLVELPSDEFEESLFRWYATGK